MLLSYQKINIVHLILLVTVADEDPNITLEIKTVIITISDLLNQDDFLSVVLSQLKFITNFKNFSINLTGYTKTKHFCLIYKKTKLL